MTESRPLLIFVSPAWPYRPINMMWADFAAELRNVGVHAMSYTARNTGQEMLQDMQGVLQDLIHWRGPKAIVSCNGNFLPPVAREGGRLISFAERYSIPLWTLMIDEPARHAGRLRAAPENSFVTIIDAQHRDFVERQGLARNGVGFFAHGGPRPTPRKPATGRWDRSSSATSPSRRPTRRGWRRPRRTRACAPASIAPWARACRRTARVTPTRC